MLLQGRKENITRFLVQSAQYLGLDPGLVPVVVENHLAEAPDRCHSFNRRGFTYGKAVCCQGGRL